MARAPGKRRDVPADALAVARDLELDRPAVGRGDRDGPLTGIGARLGRCGAGRERERDGAEAGQGAQ